MPKQDLLQQAAVRFAILELLVFLVHPFVLLVRLDLMGQPRGFLNAAFVHPALTTTELPWLHAILAPRVVSMRLRDQSPQSPVFRVRQARIAEKKAATLRIALWECTMT